MYDLKNTYDLLFVLSGILNGKSLDIEKLKSTDIKALYSLSEKHSLVSSAYFAIEPYFSLFDDKELLTRWKKAKGEAVFRQVKFDIERENILAFLTSIGCWYMPLKGTVLKELYTNPAMREMGDNDILFDEAFSAQLKDFMVSQGYSARTDIGKDDVYRKPPFFNFEMHRSLVDISDEPFLIEYYKDIKSRLIASKTNPCEMNFTDEDFYIYLTLHEYTHYTGGGTGLRAFVDTYVYLVAKNETLDWSYIGNECKKLGIAGFENKLRTLSLKLLSYPQNLNLSEEEENMLIYISSSGTYGTRENFIENDLKAQFGDNLSTAQKIKYIFGRIFLKKAQMKSRYPWVRKHPVLLPFAYIHRIFICGFSDFARLFKEAKTVWNKK